MVLIKQSCLALMLVAASAFGQSTLTAPVHVSAPFATDPACVRLDEQRANGTSFMAVCSPNSMSSSKAVQFQDFGYTVAGTNINGQNFTGTTTFSAAITMAASITVSGTRNNGSAAAPWNDIVGTNHFGEIFKIAYPGSVFATSWTMQTVAASSGASMEFLDTGGTNFITFDATNQRIETEAIRPKADATYALGDSSHRFTVGYFSNTLRFGGAETTSHIVPSADNSQDLGGNTTLDWRRIHFQDSLIQNGTTRFDSSGNVTAGNIYPQANLTHDLGNIPNEWASASVRDIYHSDGTVVRYEIFGASVGSNAGSAVRIKNAAAADVFRVRYNGTTDVVDLNVTGTCTGCGAGGGLPVVDTTGISKGSSDATKILRFEVDGFTTATTRVLTPQDNDYIIAGLNITQTFTQSPTFAAGIQVSGTHDNATSSAPWNQTFSTKSYTEELYLADPGSIYSTTWKMFVVPGTSGQYVEFHNVVGSTIMAFDGTAEILFARHVWPLVDNAYDLGSGGLSLRYRDGYFAGTMNMGAAVVSGAATFNGTVTLNSTSTFNGAPTFAASILVSGTRNNGSAAAPWNDIVGTNEFAEVFKIAYPGTAFGTTWSLRTVPASGGTSLEFLNTSGVNFITLDASNHRVITEALIPKVNTTYDLGSSGLNYLNGYIYTLNSNSITTGSINVTSAFGYQTSGTTRINSSGVFTFGGFNSNLVPTANATYSIGTPGTAELASVHSSQLYSSDGSVIRYNIITASAGSNAGAAITIKNAAGTNTFETRYNGTTSVTNLGFSGTLVQGGNTIFDASGNATFIGTMATPFTGGANANLCVNTAGLLYRGSPAC